jgi:hypothetical protein
MRVDIANGTMNEAVYTVTLNGSPVEWVVWADDQTHEVCFAEMDWATLRDTGKKVAIPDPDDPYGVRTLVSRGTVVISRLATASKPREQDNCYTVTEAILHEQDCRKQCFSLMLNGIQDNNFWTLRGYTVEPDKVTLELSLVTPDAPRIIHVVVPQPNYRKCYPGPQAWDHVIFSYGSGSFFDWPKLLDPLIYRRNQP